MEPITTGFTYPKSVPVTCRRRDIWNDLDIRGHCFWLGLMYTGEACFEIDGGQRTVDAIAPCFLCFDDRHSVRLVRKRGVLCDSVYFEPTFLNVNMTSERVHDPSYEKIAVEYDLFRLTPFTDGERFVFPLFAECTAKIKQMFAGMEQEFTRQTDWFWTCRSRSCFTELIFLLEYAYNYTIRMEQEGSVASSKNTHLQRALLFIGSHFSEDITLSDIVQAAGINHTSLTHLFNDELGMTPVGYLWHYRVQVAAKQLEFTLLPIKDISARCGFKTVQHFSRKFRSATGETPSDFRESRLRARQAGLQNGNPCCAVNANNTKPEADS